MSKPTLQIEMPDSYWAERRYIVRVIFEEFLGLQIQITKHSQSNVIITASDHRQLIIADTLFSTPKHLWLTQTSLPAHPLKIWKFSTTNLEAQLVHPNIPVIFGDNPHKPDFVSQRENQIYLGLDILGSAFFMLTRYEEVVKTERDSLDRFPVSASLAYQENFIMRPIVNEYIEILWTYLLVLWPRLTRRHHHFQTYVSHDVDEPFRYVFSGPNRLLRRCLGDVVRRKSLITAANSIKSWLEVKQGNLIADPCNTFDFIMQVSETQGLKSTFYFIADHTCHPIDGDYNLDHPLMRDLLAKIKNRGHELGLHSSFNTYKDSKQTRKEFEALLAACAQEDIHQDIWGARQHCLRWSTPITWQNLAEARLTYDSTLTFPEHVGFRCGICFDFPVFNLISRQCLSLFERPLIIMDSTILEYNYMNFNLSNGEALQTIKGIKDICRLFKGNFTLLWHNSRLSTQQEKAIYQQVIRA